MWPTVYRVKTTGQSVQGTNRRHSTKYIHAPTVGHVSMRKRLSRTNHAPWGMETPPNLSDGPRAWSHPSLSQRDRGPPLWFADHNAWNLGPGLASLSQRAVDNTPAVHCR